MKVGDSYNKLKSIKVYAIINYCLFNNNIKDIVRLKRANKIFTKKLEYQIFDLTRVDKNNQENKYYELVNLFNCDDIDALGQIITSKIYKDMLEKVKQYNLNSEEYKKMEDIERLMMNETEHYEDAYIDGKKEGKKEGIRQGKTEEKFDIAKSMLIDGIDISFISKYTNLSIKKIESLR